MTQFDVDLFVIGGGSGGVRAARVAAGHGARVAIAESSRWGGTCVIRGCVPKKLMVYASDVRRQLDDARGHGWTIPEATFNWNDFVIAKDREVARLSQGYVDRLHKANARVLEGRARLADAHTIEINGERITAAHILVSTGGTPRKPPGTWITSDDAFLLPKLPASIAILTGRLRGLATSTLKRISALPELPPIADAIPGFEVLTWQGLVAPAGTPAEIINRLHAELIRALKDPEFIARMRDMGLELYGTTPEQFTQFIKTENAKWAKVIKATGAKVD